MLKVRAFTADGTAVGDVTMREASPRGARGRHRRSCPSPRTATGVSTTGRTATPPRRPDEEPQPEIVMLGDSITHFWGGDPVGGRPHRGRGVGSILRGAPRRQPGLRVGPDGERPLEADARRVRRRQPEGRGRDDRHQQHRRSTRRTTSPPASRRSVDDPSRDRRRRASCCSASSRAVNGRIRRATWSARSIDASRRSTAVTAHLPRYRTAFVSADGTISQGGDVRLPPPDGEGLRPVGRGDGAHVDRLMAR